MKRGFLKIGNKYFNEVTCTAFDCLTIDILFKVYPLFDHTESIHFNNMFIESIEQHR